MFSLWGVGVSGVCFFAGCRFLSFGSLGVWAFFLLRRWSVQGFFLCLLFSLHEARHGIISDDGYDQ